MELKDFIKATLKDITESVKELQEEDSTGAKFNPRGVNSESKVTIKNGSGQTSISLVNVEFNVCLTESEQSETKSGIAVFFASISGGVSHKMGDNATSYNSIQFSIPLVLPETN